MNFRRLLLILLILFKAGFLVAQNDRDILINKLEYDRNSLTYLFINSGHGKYAKYLNKSVANLTYNSHKFDCNDIGIKSIKAQPTGEKELIENRIHYRLLESWWQIQADGSISTSKLEKRGRYNAKNAEAAKANASKRGDALLGDAGEKLIAKSFVFLYDLANVRTMMEYYDEKDRERREEAERKSSEFVPVERSDRGFAADLTVYLYQLNYNAEVSANFLNSFNDDGTLDLEKFNSIYEGIEKPLKLVKVVGDEIKGTEAKGLKYKKPDQELFNYLAKSAIIKGLNRLEYVYDEFKVKGVIVSKRPIKSEIGRKEGLQTDSRFSVWGYYQKSTGEVKLKKVGMVRSKKISDNTKDKAGEIRTTSFFQTSGRKIVPGMILKENPDIGMGINIGYANFAYDNNLQFGFELNISKMVNSFINTPISGLNLFLDIAPHKESDSTIYINGRNNLSYTRVTFGLSKEFYVARNTHVGFLIAGGSDQAKWEEGTDYGTFRTKMNSYGISLGVNPYKAFQIVGRAMYYVPKETVTERLPDDKFREFSESWNDLRFFPDRQGISLDVSLKILF